jgi:5'-phosphate synthase pdxT subunit
MIVGLLGLQGAFCDHIPHLTRLRAKYRLVRDVDALNHIDRLIIPGGESTVMGKFLRQYGLVSALKARMASNMPVWGICAGAILLARTVDGLPGILKALPMEVIRNAYGRQIQSREENISIPILKIASYTAVFIRAPKIHRIDQTTEVFARYAHDPVFIQRDRIMATTFHPELNPDDHFHRYFLSL